MTDSEFLRVCKGIMRPLFEEWWIAEVWERGTSIADFREMAGDPVAMDECGYEQVHLLEAELEERGVSSEEMLALSEGPAYPDKPMDVRLHHSLAFDLQEAFEVLVRNCPDGKRVPK